MDPEDLDPTERLSINTPPNVYVHMVQPLELADKSKPGNRKILDLFLIDPKRLSSALPMFSHNTWAGAALAT